MKCRENFYLFHFMAFFGRWLHVVNGGTSDSSDYKVGKMEISKPEINVRIAQTVSKGIAEFGKTFHYGMIGEVNKVTKVTTDAGEVEKMGFLLKKFPALKHIPKVAGAFGAIGTLLSIVFSFIPTGDSAELQYMKQAFTKMNKKLDEITESLKESKALIKEYSQKAAYIQSENNINDAYNKLGSIVSSLLNVSCTTNADCRRKKMKVMDNNIDKLDVRGDVETILTGVLKDSIFSTSLLKLIAEKSDCYIHKMINFKSAVATLAIKGHSAAMLYDMVTKKGYDMTDDVRRFQKLMFDLEKKTEDIIYKCYQTIDRYILSDVIDLDKKSSESSISDANANILKFLTVKYHWIEFVVVSADAGSDPLFWTNETFHSEVNVRSKSDNLKTKNFIFIGSRNRVENAIEKKQRFRKKLKSTELHYKSWLKTKYDEAIVRFLGVVEYDKYLHSQFRAIAVLPDYDDALVGYIGPNGAIEQEYPRDYEKIEKNDLLVYQQCINDKNCKMNYKPLAVIASIHNTDKDILECSHTCNLHGTCYFLPHTKIMGCKCDADHYGEDCSLKVSNTNMALDLIKLIDISFTLPSLFDVSNQLDDVRIALQADLNDIQHSIEAMDEKLRNIFDAFSKDLMTSLNLHGLLTRYGQIVRDIKYYYEILIEKNETAHFKSDLPFYPIKLQQSLDTKEKEELARTLIKPTELRRSLDFLSYLFFGRDDIPLISHKPLLFLTMDKYRSQLCSSDYKRILDDAYKQITLLEFHGYTLWLHALQLAQVDTFFVVKRYEDVVRRHGDFFDRYTCKVAISNSVNFANCTNGFYMYSGMTEDVNCATNFYLSKQSISLYVAKVIRVSSELSRTESSAREIVGHPNVYPSFGNNTQAWSPSSDEIDDSQFIEVSFKDPLFIDEIEIYETFHGGAVWKIEGLNEDGTWKVLKEKSKQQLKDIKTANVYKETVQINWSTSQLRLNIDCTMSKTAVQIDAIQITGKPVKGTCSWYDSLSCSPCGCDSVGSSSTTCSSDGQCACKTGYKGKRCSSKDCVIGHWSAWSDCECGPGKTKTRTRQITQNKYGSGKECGKTSETADCNLICVCGVGERGDYCQHKDCLMGEWGSWSDCPEQEARPNCHGDQNRYAKQYRKRSKVREKQNNGASCKSNKDEKNCPKPKCKQLDGINIGWGVNS